MLINLYVFGMPNVVPLTLKFTEVKEVYRSLIRALKTEDIRSRFVLEELIRPANCSFST
jgi:hypothetical protein